MVTISGSGGITFPDGSTEAIAGNISLGTSYIFNGTETYKDFPIPANAKRITIMLSGLSSNGTSIMEVRLGISSGIVATNYNGIVTELQGAFTGSNTNLTTGFKLSGSVRATDIRVGSLVLTNSNANNFVAVGNIGVTNTTYNSVIVGNISLSDTLTTIRITTVNGTDLFDANSIVTLMWEG